MSDVVVVAIIGGVFSLLVGLLSFAGVVISNSKSNRDVQYKIKTAQEVTDTKLEELTREVRTHNDFAMKIPVMQEEINRLKARVQELESLHKRGA